MDETHGMLDKEIVLEVQKRRDFYTKKVDDFFLVKQEYLIDLMMAYFVLSLGIIMLFSSNLFFIGLMTTSLCVVYIFYNLHFMRKRQLEIMEDMKRI